MKNKKNQTICILGHNSFLTVNKLEKCLRGISLSFDFFEICFCYKLVNNDRLASDCMKYLIAECKL